MQIYIKGTKKEANQKLQEGKEVGGFVYSLFQEDYKTLQELPSGTVIKFYTNMIGGTPIAKSYGKWKKEKNKIL